MNETSKPRTYFGFDSRTYEETGVETYYPWKNGIAAKSSVRFKVPLGHHFGCRPKKLVVTAFMTDGYDGVALPIARMPVKLLSATVNSKPQLPLGHSSGIVLGLQPTIEDVLDYEGTPYRMEGPPASKLTQEQAHIFRTMTPLDISGWESFDLANDLFLEFENLVGMLNIHVFGYVEGESFDHPSEKLK